MAFRIAQFNILGRHMAGTMWFHYARDFLPRHVAAKSADWTPTAGFPRCLLWQPSDGQNRFHRFPVLLAEIRALRADVLCLVELDCFGEFHEALGAEGYDAVFAPRPGKGDGCGIFWRRDVFEASAEQSVLTYTMPAGDRIALAQPLLHKASSKKVLVVSTHLHWDQRAGHQVSEAAELLRFAESAALTANVPSMVVCTDLNALPGTEAYELLKTKLGDASGEGYDEGAFTSMKPDVYYYAWPRGRKGDPNAKKQWHLQEGRREVIDYIFYDEGSLEVEVAPEIPTTSEKPAKKRKRAPYGYWAGNWAFASSPAPGFAEGLTDPAWRPARDEGELQLGIPNRAHGSDHLPVACTLRWRET